MERIVETTGTTTIDRASRERMVGVPMYPEISERVFARKTVERVLEWKAAGKPHVR